MPAHGGSRRGAGRHGASFYTAQANAASRQRQLGFFRRYTPSQPAPAATTDDDLELLEAGLAQREHEMQDESRALAALTAATPSALPDATDNAATASRM